MIATAEEFIALRMSDRPEEYTRAATDSATVEVWSDVIRRFPGMRTWVAHNKTVPPEILSMLANDEDPDVRIAVAMKNSLPPDLMTLLAQDSEEAVRERIVYNKRTPVQILEHLAQDPCERISSRARERLRANSV